MKKSLLYKATVIAMLFCVTYNISDAQSPPDWLRDWLSDKAPNECGWIKFHNEDYQFDIHPSADCDTIKAIFFSNFWESGAAEMYPGYKTVNILIDNASQELYIPFKTVTYSYPTSIESYKKSHPTKYIDSWIRAKWEGDKLVFKDRSLIGVNNYDLEFEDDWFAMSDTICIYGAKPQTHSCKMVVRGSFDIPDGYGFVEEIDYGLCYKMEYTYQDVTFDFNRAPLLVRNPNSALYIGPYDSTEYINGDFYIPKNEAFFNDMLIGVLSPNAPDYLPAPEAQVRVEWIPEKWDKVLDEYLPGHTNMTAQVKLDLVTDDGYIIDPAKITANILADGKCIYTCGVNPFFNDDQWLNETIRLSWDRERWKNFPKIEVKCVYRTEEGVPLVSPLVEANVKIIRRPSGSGIDENMADKVFIDHSTYDLTGRKVDPENLAPGIYIRDGRKFTVGRH